MASERPVVDQTARDRASEALRGLMHVDQLTAEKHARVMDQISYAKEQIQKLERSFQDGTAKTDANISKIDTDLGAFASEMRDAIRGIYTHLWLAVASVLGLLVVICGFLLVQTLFRGVVP